MTKAKPTIITTCLCAGCGESLPSITAHCPHCVGGGPGREVVEGVDRPVDPPDQQKANAAARDRFAAHQAERKANP